MASLGFQTVYRLWNAHAAMRCERAFVDASLFGEEIRSFETGDRLGKFDVVGYSVSFELDIPNVLRSLISSHLPLYAADRMEKDPVIFIGGAVASLNPSPLLPYTDGLQVGEGEDLLPRMADVFFEGKINRWSRHRVLDTLSGIEGLFIPSISQTAKRHVVVSLEDHPVFTSIVTPKSHFSNMFVVEMGRGCGRGCAFCAAQKIYQPCRYRSSDGLLETIDRFNPGAMKIGLEGAGLSDYPNLETFCHHLLDKGLKVSFSSLRPDRIRKDFLNVVDRSGIRTFTIAPESGDEALRNRIGKGIRNRTLLDAARQLADSSVQILKLYFLIGLPGETEQDINSIPNLVRELSGVFLAGRGKRSVRLSINAFVPKPYTEFQWAAMDKESTLSKKRKMIKDGLHGVKGVVMVPKSLKEEMFQGVLSVGDKDIGHAVCDMVKQGISWKQTSKARMIDMDHLLHRERSFEESLPWDWLEYPIGKNVLWRRFQKAIYEQ